MYTNKKDWLSEILEVKGFVSNDHQLKFIKLNDFYCFFMLVDSCEYDKIMEVVNSRLYRLLNSKIGGMFVLGYENNKYKIFKGDGNMMMTFDDVTLKNYFENLYPSLVLNAGTEKYINKTTSDVVHDWIRKNLSKYAIINDIDALHYYKDSVVFLELKRVKQSIYTWMPYIDDYSNYASLEFFKNELGIPYQVIAYNHGNTEDEKKFVALHNNLNITKEQITGKRIIINSSSLLSYPFGETYSSRATLKNNSIYN
jgi:hypothetical protein